MESNINETDRVIYYKASRKLNLLYLDVYTKSHEFADGKGKAILFDGLSRVEADAFANCKELTSIVIPTCIKKNM